MNFISNSILQANLSLFSSRFPDLAKTIGLHSIKQVRSYISNLDSSVMVQKSKTGETSLIIKNKYVHSRYCPLKEANKIITTSPMFSAKGCIFLGLGLGYIPEAYNKAFPNSPILIIEPSKELLALALASRPLDILFGTKKLIFLCHTKAEETPLLIEETGFFSLPLYEIPAFHTIHPEWVKIFNKTYSKITEKKNINKNTLTRFGQLWIKNICKNIFQLSKHEGIKKFLNIAKNETVLLLAAGPSLDQIIPHLVHLHKKAIIIAVDTAVRACIAAKIEPDFIIVTDPQYINWKHLESINSPNSILITELAAWSQVFRFTCKNIFLTASRFPLARFFESKGKTLSLLGAGGSVATTAWDFAVYLGVSKIYVAGLDLAFPNRQTHFKGSLFEENAHVCSTRVNPSETASFQSLYGAYPYPEKNDEGGTVLTDKRLSLFSWWFESRLAQEPYIKTKSITKGGIEIKGIVPSSITEILNQKNKRVIINQKLDKILNFPKDTIPKHSIEKMVIELKHYLNQIVMHALKGIEICSLIIHTQNSLNLKEFNVYVKKLHTIDNHLIQNPAKPIIAFFMEEKITTIEKTQEISSFHKSKDIYNLFVEIANKHLHLLDLYCINT